MATLAVLFGASTTWDGLAGQTRDELVVSADWLMEHIDDPGVVVLAAQSRGYAQGHIPGAYHFLSRSVSYSEGEETDPHMVVVDLLEDLEAVRAAFEEAGVSDESRVVVTFDGRGYAPATRLIWTANVVGLERVSLLDGGNAAWTEAGGKLVTDVPQPSRGRITSSPELHHRVLKSDVVTISRLLDISHGDPAGVALLDARSDESFSGAEEEIPGRAGHIPGARNVPFDVLFDGAKLRPEPELRRIFTDAGVQPGDRVVTYCYIGLRATAVALAARTLGHEVAMYDGSTAEWVRDPSLPLVKR